MSGAAASHEQVSRGAGRLAAMIDLEARQTIRNIAIGRIAFGVAMVLLPRFLGTRWVGSDADSSGAKVLTRALGARDVALGVITLDAVEEDRPVRQAAELGVFCDLVDAAGTLVAGRSVPFGKRIVTALIAGGAAAAAIAVLDDLD